LRHDQIIRRTKTQASEQYLQNQTELTQLDAAVIQAEARRFHEKPK
jgi:hypothetical protein